MPTHCREYIPLDKCEHGRLYRIFSRNLSLGVYNADSLGFIGVRHKFGHDYLFTEYHWDLGAAQCGTVKPYEALDLYPGEVWESRVHTVTQEEVDAALAKGLSAKELPTVGRDYYQDNHELRKWLDDKGIQYANRPNPNPGR